MGRYNTDEHLQKFFGIALSREFEKQKVKFVCNYVMNLKTIVTGAFKQRHERCNPNIGLWFTALQLRPLRLLTLNWER